MAKITRLMDFGVKMVNEEGAFIIHYTRILYI